MESGQNEFLVDEHLEIDVEGAGTFDGEVFCRQTFTDRFVCRSDAWYEQRPGERQADREDETLHAYPKNRHK